MKQEENLILRQNDVGNDIVFLFDAKLDDITSAEFRLIKPDNTFVIITGNVKENTATFTITEQCCTIPGRCHFNLRLINTKSNIYTYVSNCIIDINLNLEDAIESTAEANAYTFPDDFALKSEIPDIDNFATKNYVDNAISSIPVYTPPNYSMVEQNTGLKWIDGKPIYQKTFNIAPNGYTDISGINIDKVVSGDGVMELNNGAFYHLNIYGSETYKAFYEIDVTNGRLNTIVGSGWTATNITLTIYYTKTTDTTNS